MARRRSREATEDAILGATISLVADHGADGFTLSDVAERAGVNRALIYHYFEDRDRLLNRAMERAVERSREGRPAVGLLTTAQVLETFARDPEMDRFFLRFLTSGMWPPAIVERFTSVIEEAERLKARRGFDFDVTMAVATTALAVMAWRCAREQCAAALGILLTEADRRFLEVLTGDAIGRLEQLASEPG